MIQPGLNENRQVAQIFVFQVGEHTVEELKDINNQLYKFALKNILKT